MARKPEQNMMSSEKSLDAQCRESMRKGSLSFFLASRLLPSKMRSAIFRLYMWCRYCDDEIDQASLDGSTSELVVILSRLKEQTLSCYRPGFRHQHPVFQAFASIVREYQIPKEYPLELLAGMEMDIKGHAYRSQEDLELYCYRVAGTVGLMCCHVFGVRNEEALAEADAMGRAMQMTNIARDILDDARLGRVYIPDTWFQEGVLSSEDILALEDHTCLEPLATRLIDTAEIYYQQGEKGLINLPWQCALAVCAARYIYSEIGEKVKNRGSEAWLSRTWIRLPRKLALLTKAIFKTILQIPERIQRPWHAVDIKQVRGPGLS